MNERGVLRGENKEAAAPCLATVTAWKYWDEGEWTPGDIALLPPAAILVGIKNTLFNVI